MGGLRDLFGGEATPKIEQAIERLIQNGYAVTSNSPEMAVLNRSNGEHFPESEVYAHRTGEFAGQVEFYMDAGQNPKMTAETFLDTQRSIARHNQGKEMRRLAAMTPRERELDKTLKILREEGFTEAEQSMAAYTFERELEDGTKEVVNLYDKHAFGSMLFIRNGEIDMTINNIWDYNDTMRPGPVTRGLNMLKKLF